MTGTSFVKIMNLTAINKQKYFKTLKLLFISSYYIKYIGGQILFGLAKMDLTQYNKRAEYG